MDEIVQLYAIYKRYISDWETNSLKVKSGKRNNLQTITERELQWMDYY